MIATFASIRNDFNPRSPHGERRHDRADCDLWTISIHAPRTGSDTVIVYISADDCDFNPRSPHGERRRRREEAF